MLQIHTRVVTPTFQQNSRLLVDSQTNQSVLIDPGGDAEMLFASVQESGTELTAIALTHSHLDHCAGVAAFLRLHGEELPLLGHEIEAPFRANVSKIAAQYELDPSEFEDCPEPTQYLDDGDILKVGGLEATALFTPGHSPGHLSFYFENVDWNLDGQAGSGPVVVAGDALFNGSIGRTDLPGGNHTQLIESIKTRLLTLPAETLVLCGHGPETTIGREARMNPFLE